MDSYWALAAFAGWILLGFAVALIVLLIQKCERLEGQVGEWKALHAQQGEYLDRFRKFDADGDGRPGGRRSNLDPHIERAIALAKEPSTRP